MVSRILSKMQTESTPPSSRGALASPGSEPRD
jgi:hypothetical protein